MNVMLVVRDLNATPSLRGRIEDVSAEFDRFFHDLRRVSWSLRLEAGRIKASCALSARSGEYRAHASHAAAAGAALGRMSAAVRGVAIGVAAPALLALCRFGQGLGLGGEWGGAVLLAIENAPPGKRAWYGMFPQLGAPLGFFLSTTVFLALSRWLGNDRFAAFGWRVPFLASAVLVLVGLYVRLKIAETPVFTASLRRRARVKIPMLVVLREYPGTVAAGTLMSLATFVIFYLMTVFTLSWGTSALGFTREEFLRIQLVGVVCFAVTIPISARLAEGGRRRMLVAATIAIALFGLVMAPLFAAGTTGAVLTLATGLGLMGLTYGPLGTVLTELFPTDVRYTGSSLTFNLAGIVGASLAPYIATSLANRFGLAAVGYYLTGTALLSLVGLGLTRETRDEDLTR